MIVGPEAVEYHGRELYPWCGGRLTLKLHVMGFILRARKNKPRLKIDQALGAFPRPEQGDISPLYTFFEITNISPDNAEVSRLHVTPTGAEKAAYDGNFEGDQELPCTLQPGEKARFWVRARTLANALKEAGYPGRPRVRFVVGDGSGNSHEKSFKFRVDEYLRLER